MIGKQLLRGVLGDGEGVDQLDDGLFLVQLALLVHTFGKNLGHFSGIFQNLCQTGIVFCLKIDLRQLFFDVGKAEGNVFIHGHIGPQGIVLEQEAHLALVGGHVDAQTAVKNHLVADGDAPAGGCFQTRDHAQGRGLAAAGGTQQGDKRVVADGQIQILHRIEFAPALVDML